MRFLDLIASLGDRRGRAIVVDPDRALADRAAAVASLAKVETWPLERGADSEGVWKGLEES